MGNYTGLTEPLWLMSCVNLTTESTQDTSKAHLSMLLCIHFQENIKCRISDLA